MKKYLAVFWRNDGGWHSEPYERQPVFVFEARNDKLAKQYASSYTAYNAGGNDFWLTKLFRVLSDDTIEHLQFLTNSSLYRIIQLLLTEDVKIELEPMQLSEEDTTIWKNSSKKPPIREKTLKKIKFEELYGKIYTGDLKP
ncbi:MAG: hypothetical protein KAS32_30240 [Candidatus Peribacteraceae bacterium]|nr:hypothetical protein [Candidatus Peribacteraceae bacterium]